MTESSAAPALPEAGEDFAARLAAAFRAASPLGSPEPTPLASWLIHGGIAALWLILLVGTFLPDASLPWSVGIVYVAYDTLLLVFVAWMARTMPAAGAVPVQGPAARSAVTVVIAAYDEAERLPATIAALLAQGRPPAAIVVADDGSRDGTAADLARLYGFAAPRLGAIAASPTHPTLRWLRLPHGGKARAMNAALAHVRTDLVATVDADTLLDEGALAGLVAAFERDPALVTATGILRPQGRGTLGARLLRYFQAYEYVRNFTGRYAWMRTDGLLLISGAFAGYRTRALVAVGGFDEDCLVEDYELTHRLRRHAARAGLHWTTAVIGEATASTASPGTVGRFLRQRRRWFGGFLQVQHRYRAMVGNPSYGRMGTLMLPVKAADAFQPIYGLAAIGVALWYVATGRASALETVTAVVASKLALDLLNQAWLLHNHRRWAGAKATPGLVRALPCILLEPFTFQILRHLGAAWGWIAFFRSSRRWD